VGEVFARLGQVCCGERKKKKKKRTTNEGDIDLK